MSDGSFVYRYRRGLYLNITNRCPSACAFCIKSSWGMRFRGRDLRLNGREPSPAEVSAAAQKSYGELPFKEIVFCGYGEATYRLADMLAICGEVRERLPEVRRRLNTVGLGDMICGRPIAAELAGSLEGIRISLNTADERQWAEIMRPLPEFRERGFQSVTGFIRACASRIPDTAATAVELPGVDISACRSLARSLGVRLITRPYLEGYEDR